MCEFVSWIKTPDGYLYYLTTQDVLSKEGAKKLLNNGKVSLTDLNGHGAIREFYPELKSKHLPCREVNLNSTYKEGRQKDFPREIVDDIFAGNFRYVGIGLQLVDESYRERWQGKVAMASQILENLKIYHPTHRDIMIRIYRYLHDEFWGIWIDRSYFRSDEWKENYWGHNATRRGPVRSKRA